MILISFFLKNIFLFYFITILNIIIYVYCNVSLIIFVFVFLYFLNFKKTYAINLQLYKNLKLQNKYYFNHSFFFLILFFIFYFLFFVNNNFRFSIIWYKKKMMLINAIIDLNFSFDVINIYFILLSFFVFGLIFVNSKNFFYLSDINKTKNRLQILLFFLIEFFIILTFSTSNIFFFFFFFECSLIPVYLLMIISGKGVEKKHYAALSLVFFTLVGSIFLLFAILYFFIVTNSCDFKNINYEFIDVNSQIILFILFILGFSVKVPIFPFYSWLPEAHVEAATPISILLAAIFLKVATYGLLKIVVFNMFMPIHFLYSFLFYFSLISTIFISFLTLSQTDLKKIIAMSSIIHMNYIVLGLFSLDAKATVSAVIYMFSHALVSTGLFYVVGLIYDNTGTRDLLNFSNNFKYSQNIFFFFFVFNLSNLSFPMTISFIAELMLLNNLANFNIFVIVFLLFSVFFSIVYTFWMIHNFFFSKNKNVKNIVVLNIFDFLIMFLLMFLIFFLGLIPFVLFYNLEQEIYLLFINKFSIY